MPARSDGQEGCDFQVLVSPVFFNAWKKSRFLHFVPSYSTGSPLAQGGCKGLSWRDLIPINTEGSSTSLAMRSNSSSSYPGVSWELALNQAANFDCLTNKRPSGPDRVVSVTIRADWLACLSGWLEVPGSSQHQTQKSGHSRAPGSSETGQAHNVQEESKSLFCFLNVLTF